MPSLRERGTASAYAVGAAAGGYRIGYAYIATPVERRLTLDSHDPRAMCESHCVDCDLCVLLRDVPCACTGYSGTAYTLYFVLRPMYKIMYYPKLYQFLPPPRCVLV